MAEHAQGDVDASNHDPYAALGAAPDTHEVQDDQAQPHQAPDYQGQAHYAQAPHNQPRFHHPYEQQHWHQGGQSNQQPHHTLNQSRQREYAAQQLGIPQIAGLANGDSFIQHSYVGWYVTRAKREGAEKRSWSFVRAVAIPGSDKVLESLGKKHIKAEKRGPQKAFLTLTNHQQEAVHELLEDARYHDQDDQAVWELYSIRREQLQTSLFSSKGQDMRIAVILRRLGQSSTRPLDVVSGQSGSTKYIDLIAKNHTMRGDQYHRGGAYGRIDTQNRHRHMFMNGIQHTEALMVAQTHQQEARVAQERLVLAQHGERQRQHLQKQLHEQELQTTANLTDVVSDLHATIMKQKDLINKQALRSQDEALQQQTVCHKLDRELDDAHRLRQFDDAHRRHQLERRYSTFGFPPDLLPPMSPSGSSAHSDYWSRASRNSRAVYSTPGTSRSRSHSRSRRRRSSNEYDRHHRAHHDEHHRDHDRHRSHRGRHAHHNSNPHADYKHDTSGTDSDSDSSYPDHDRRGRDHDHAHRPRRHHSHRHHHHGHHRPHGVDDWPRTAGEEDVYVGAEAGYRSEGHGNGYRSEGHGDGYRSGRENGYRSGRENGIGRKAYRRSSGAWRGPYGDEYGYETQGERGQRMRGKHRRERRHT